MNDVLIRESKVLSILGFHFDYRLTWSYMIDSSVRRCRQRLGCLRWISEYLGTEGLTLAYRAFVHPVAEYGGILMMGVSCPNLIVCSTLLSNIWEPITQSNNSAK